MENNRKETLKLLNKTFKDNSYSNILLDNVLSDQNISQQDRRFITSLYYGVIERKITLDYIISLYSSKSIKKLDATVLNILRMGIYQIKYMDGIPDNAAVNESVKLVRSFKLASAAGFVNAVLRHFIRDGCKFHEPEETMECLSVRYSVDPGIIKILYDGYGSLFAETFLERLNNKPPVYLRINSIYKDEDKFFDGLGPIIADKKNFPDFCSQVSGGNLVKTRAFSEGRFHVQDISSQLACAALAPCEGETVLDLCSAPGGKAFTMAEIMNNTGHIYAFDIHQSRVELIKQGAKRLGIKNIETLVGDASEYNERFRNADKVLCDVPCSGIGVMGKKPDIRYKSPEEFEKLPELQYKILENAARYLKTGGELVYSTCTLNPRENDQVIDKFLSEHENFKGVSFFEELGNPFGDYKVTLGTDPFNGDGFFISKIKRKE